MTPTTLNHISSAHVYPVLPAEYLVRARAFYHDILGFEVQDRPEASQFLIHAGEGTGFVVYETGHTKAEHTVATIVVDDLAAAMSDLRSRGVKFEEYDLPNVKTVDGVASMGGEQSAWFTDSEGNIISLAHMN
jgi:predicted enzyme related to lactoylglutathione lyase